MADEIKLGLNVGSTYEVLEKTASGLKDVRQAASAAAESYEVLAGAGSNFAQVEAQTERLVNASVEQTRQQRILGQFLDEIPPKASAASKGVNQFGSAMLSTSYAVQDFTSQLGTRGLSGALSAVQNNIPTIITQLGAGAGLAGVVSVVVVGAGLLYDNWDKLTTGFETTLPVLPKLSADLENVGKVLSTINKQIGDLEEKSLTDALSHPELKRLEQLRSLQSDAANQAADAGLVEGIKSSTGDKYKALTEQVKKAVAAAGGGVAVAGDIANTIGAEYKEGAAKLADVLRGATALDVENLRRDSPAFRRAFDALEEELDREAEEHMKRVQNANDVRLQEYQKHVQEVFQQQVDQIGDMLLGGIRRIVDTMQKQIEDEQAKVENDPLRGRKEYIRDVENKDFYRLDQFGREQSGLGLSSNQVAAAAQNASNFQRDLGVDERTAAQMAIQEQVFINQQQIAARTQRTQMQVNGLLNMGGFVPTIMEFGW